MTDSLETGEAEMRDDSDGDGSKNDHQAEAAENSSPKSGKSRFLAKLGIALILLSGVCFFTMLAVPFFPLGTGLKVGLGGTLFVCVQVSWWVGAAMLGPAAINRFKGWFRRNNN